MSVGRDVGGRENRMGVMMVGGRKGGIRGDIVINFCTLINLNIGKIERHFFTLTDIA